ncbi:hypothetical protein [Mycoplasma suis]|uniref:Uncharacterized protein n=1 Tax=Mycoplasma suis (strain Illinois) TaxID=768700 RepID=F0QQ27_MYCSL|nr:hypothetical protein [Mycoplasma suis]ADX97597.1 hypothetical protein MSU_0053 [Mycoplasma suis str. Illinois]
MKLLGKIFSTLFIGALGGGTITGVVQLVNNGNDEVKDSRENKDHLFQKEQKQHHPSEPNHVVFPEGENKDTFDTEIISLEEIPPKGQEKYPFSESSSSNQLDMNDKNSEKDDPIEIDGITLEVKDQENLPTEMDLEENSRGDFSEQKKFSGRREDWNFIA